MKAEVIGIGEALWDVFDGHKQMGGAPANFAYHVSRLGIGSLAISAVGNDPLGDELAARLGDAGANFDLQRVDRPTGTVQVTLAGDGIPQYEICRPAAWDFIAMKPEYAALAQAAKAVCFGSLAQRGAVSRDTIREFVARVPETALKVFDINLRQSFYTQTLIEDSLRLCSVLKINDDEVRVVAGLFGLNGNDRQVCAALLRQFNLKLVALTCGTRGSYLITARESSFRQTPTVTVADTVGAGDSFTAALVAGLLRGNTLGEVHNMAVRLSAFVCTQPGAMPAYDGSRLFGQPGERD